MLRYDPIRIVVSTVTYSGDKDRNQDFLDILSLIKAHLALLPFVNYRLPDDTKLRETSALSESARYAPPNMMTCSQHSKIAYPPRSSPHGKQRHPLGLPPELRTLSMSWDFKRGDKVYVKTTLGGQVDDTVVVAPAPGR